MEISFHVKVGALGQVNLPKMLNRNWKKQVVKKIWKLSKRKEKPAVTKAENAGKEITVKLGNFGPKEGSSSILMSNYKSREFRKNNQGKRRKLWAKGGCSFYFDEDLIIVNHHT